LILSSAAVWADDSALPDPAPVSALVDFFRCPSSYDVFDVADGLSPHKGYFTFADAVCFGRLGGAFPSPTAGERLPAAAPSATVGSRVCVPFDMSEVADDLRYEQYRTHPSRWIERLTSAAAARGLYYFLRPVLSVAVRKHLQKIRLSGWAEIAFPRWPVDCTVETVMESALATLLRNGHAKRIPFVWFWPDGAQSCAVVTHDVEGPAGRDFCAALMDIDESAGVKSSFQLIPEMPRPTWRALADPIRARGFEVNLHDLNHDGYLFHTRREFLERAARINAYAREFQCRGFRSGAMYRMQRWFDAFDFSFDMSVPTVAHLEPQRGGCCTVMPYFIGSVLELPLTTIQDYSLFHILGDYSIEIWRRQIAAITARNGLLMFLAHPDYMRDVRGQAVYVALLSYLRELRREQHIWSALPSEVDEWWRRRSHMTVERDQHGWKVVGEGSERARVAIATLENDRLVYQIDDRGP
jgi:hypothetical protein